MVKLWLSERPVLEKVFLVKAEKVKILLGLGGNLPSGQRSPLQTVRESIELMQKLNIEITSVSPFFETEPVPASGQPNFINAAVIGNTTHRCDVLLGLIKELEVKLGRQPAERWSARTIDIDILAYGDSVFPNIKAWQDVVNDADPAAILAEPVVPHPRLHKRAFVLAPLSEIAGKWKHPVLGQTVKEMMKADLIVEQMPHIRKLQENQ
ncbi:2-amino-4-hydroxy-6-hydroxymethyldihydropteridine diphosphokinase [Kordiimonas sp. SCSIO 12603]|uniref:2-amino-4-hydroxy-6- hydroxymethyldihydropteridine diphosphokinase n=1 Tax=Kordiimonas sp. SCSIO 12603 TaxID=2829596 RepID=UPI002104A86F|nr:2-amino-4-hydroxy-6-hydroxymethyldihydropteridine diphosphokinase [Kordiimonas sp. SCSIO 12603]UTW57062.1 2-amino-4-hydroxy-6-hydroxymethyldihydropteridine diphosphokinase [Kordiimonas sp. SCSIO 12603]